MQVRINEGEWWHVYKITTSNFGVLVEVTEEQVTRWKATTEAFKKVQEEMSVLYDKTNS